jgi:hypothetical protein
MYVRVCTYTLHYARVEGWGEKWRITLRVVGEMRVEVELGNKRECRNRIKKSPRQRMRRWKYNLLCVVKRTEKLDKMLLQNCNWRLKDIPHSQHFLVVGYFFYFKKTCTMQKCRSWILLSRIYYHRQPTEMEWLEIKVTVRGPV